MIIVDGKTWQFKNGLLIIWVAKHTQTVKCTTSITFKADYDYINSIDAFYPYDLHT